MIKANIVVDKKIWEKKLKKPEIYFKKKLNKLSKFSSFKNKNQEFTVMLTNNKKMKDLNLKFRNKNVSTDVLGHLKEISVVDFDHTDVVRHPLVSKIVKAYSDQKTE